MSIKVGIEKNIRKFIKKLQSHPTANKSLPINVPAWAVCVCMRMYVCARMCVCVFGAGETSGKGLKKVSKEQL